MLKKLFQSFRSPLRRTQHKRSTPEVLNSNQHSLQRAQFSRYAVNIVERLQNAGYQAYLVGGCVRDMLLNITPKDFDVATSATPEQVRAEFRNARIIGRRFKEGVDLSGGQWQKIAIARAYMRDAQVMILDEPTAALDARSEFEVFERFKELSDGKTAVLISHRFSSVRMADRILVLADGKVESSGTHDQLMAQGGRYAELFELQAAGYR